MAEVFGTAGPFIIAEQTGEKRVLELAGRALPYRPISFVGIQKINKNWYPGNPVATAQVLGPEEEDSTIHGMWKNRFLGNIDLTTGSTIDNPDAQVLFNGRYLRNCEDVVLAVDDIRRKGQLLKVGWGPEIRYGFLVKFKKDWDREQDVAWEMDFSWISIEDPTGMQTVTPQVNNTSNWVSRLKQLMSDVMSAFKGYIATVQDYEDMVHAAISKLEDSIQNVFDTIDSLANAVLDPLTVASRLMALCTRVSMQAGDVLDNMASRVPWASRSSLPGDVGPKKKLPNVETMPMGQRIVADVQYRTLRRSLRLVQAESMNQAQDASKQINPDLIAVFYPREGSDLRDISTKYYGVPSHWRQLAKFNNLHGSILHANQLLMVPRLRQLESQLSDPPLKPAVNQ